MHCDSVTVCADRGADLRENGFQLDLKRLVSSACAAQCFAIFTEGETALKDFERYLAFYKRMLLEHGDLIFPVKNYADLEAARAVGKVGAILTVENLGFIGTDLDRLNALEKDGVCMASLVWNYENALARPSIVFENGLPAFEKREERGLTDLGREAAEKLDKLNIIIDISHLSDGGADDLVNGRKIPLVARHAHAQGAFNVSRNLTDGQIKKIADCGGVVGVNFCFDFLGLGGGFESVYNHITHIINVGGEEVVALGSDFDGIPLSPQLEDCTRMQALFEYLNGCGLPYNFIEKLAYKNFFRVFKEVRG